MVNILIFGTGETYKNKKNFFENNRDRIKIIAFLDNNPELQGKTMDGIIICSPKEIQNLCFDGVVILSLKYMQEMTDELQVLGIKQDLIWNFNMLKLTAFRGKRTLYGESKNIPREDKGNVLIITTDMEFNGGTMVSVYAAQALQDKGYDVMLSAPSILEELLEEVLQAGLKITIVDCLPYLFEEDEKWIQYYDIVIVNVFQMMNCAYGISKIKPVLWWIHEDRSIWKSFYQDTQKEFADIDRMEWMSRVDVVGVSKIAQEAFNYFYPSVIQKILPFGIPDRCRQVSTEKILKDKVIFAVTAGFSIYKGQRVLVEAVRKLSQQEKDKIEIWFIGPKGQNLQELKEICDEREYMRFLGLLSHEEIISLLPQIDVLVCPSLIETMSMSTIEGMMFGKLCIITDMTGIAEYIKNGENGFVVKAGDSDQLAERIAWIIHNRGLWEPIKRNARKTFEEEFALEKFGEKLETELKKCREEYHESFSNVSATIS